MTQPILDTSLDKYVDSDGVTYDRVTSVIDTHVQASLSQEGDGLVRATCAALANQLAAKVPPIAREYADEMGVDPIDYLVSDKFKRFVRAQPNALFGASRDMGDLMHKVMSRIGEASSEDDAMELALDIHIQREGEATADWLEQENYFAMMGEELPREIMKPYECSADEAGEDAKALFRLFKQWDVKVVESEFTVWDEGDLIAGTQDAILEIGALGGALADADLKTGKVKPIQIAGQLMAYRDMRWASEDLSDLPERELCFAITKTSTGNYVMRRLPPAMMVAGREWFSMALWGYRNKDKFKLDRALSKKSLKELREQINV